MVMVVVVAVVVVVEWWWWSAGSQTLLQQQTTITITQKKRGDSFKERDSRTDLAVVGFPCLLLVQDVHTHALELLPHLQELLGLLVL
jgi:hypothetical protein